MGELTHAETQDLLSSFVLGATRDDERQALERHLAGCAECREELKRYERLVEALARSARRLSPLVGPGAEVVPGPRPARTPSDPSPLLIRTVARLIAATVIALAVVSALTVFYQHREFAQLRRSVASSLVSNQAELALLDPSAKHIVLTGGAGHGVLLLAATRSSGSSFIVNTGLPALDSARTYELWELIDGRSHRMAVLGSDPGVTSFQLLRSGDALAVTVEPAGGVAQPTQSPLAEGQLTG